MGVFAAKKGNVYKNTVKGFSIKVPAAALQGLLKNPKVKYIEQDQLATTVSTTQSNATWGLDRVDQQSLPLNSTYTYKTTGSTVDAYIFDTGIRPDHVEFSGRVVSGYFDPFIATSTNDGDGHGTHVAGTVGGTKYGIAKAINLIAVKVLDDNGSGTYSGIIAGLDWAVGNHVSKPAVGNMSLGGGESNALDAAVRRAINDGIVMCVAAGNSNQDASRYSPARVVEAITVGSTTSSDARASDSNYGSVLDLFAPGSSITSASIGANNATAILSGTSMASPHVAGVAALYLEANPGSTPPAVTSGLKASATPNKVKSAGTGSPNLLLYSGSLGGGIVTPPPTPTDPLSAPNSLSPSSGQYVSTSPTLTWSSVTGASSYDVQVSVKSNFSKLVKNASVTGTSYLATKLRSRTLYYWRVRAKSSTAPSSGWSVASFRTN